MADLMQVEPATNVSNGTAIGNIVDETESGLQMTQTDDDLDKLTLRFFRDAPVIIEKSSEKVRKSICNYIIAQEWITGTVCCSQPSHSRWRANSHCS